jgi:hypothetical protein
MQEHFGTCVANKLNNTEMELVLLALQKLGVSDRVDFLNRLTLTVRKHIFVPFEIGVPRGKWDLWSQIVACVHEHQHVVQYDRTGLEYELTYFADRAARINYEVEALRSNLELGYWRTGKTPSTKTLAESLRDCACQSEDVEVAAKALSLAAVSIRRGAILNESSQVAIDWLNQHASEFAVGKAV